MESLIIGGLQGLLNYAGVSLLDKLKVNKYKRKIAEGTATTVECAKIISMYQGEKDSFEKMVSCCEQLIQKDKQLHIAYTMLGLAYLHQPLSFGSIPKEKLMSSDNFGKAKKNFELAFLAKEDATRNDYKGLDDLRVFAQTNGMLNYHYGFILHMEGDETKAQEYKKLGLNQVEHTKGFLPY
ncbi:hypothetical protein [Rufibacter tibetensis]|uniref:Uncharacterized protein n=1 Tax=Rufibacter tibetensis TaxID=512763 RepID=A0A0P0CR62_9BACT|nr:hypothetical protein [Rufibacter tibetensis]ALI98933.1 hypothetical protein DC20_08020 [Rufibacter tibetensis]